MWKAWYTKWLVYFLKLKQEKEILWNKYMIIYQLGMFYFMDHPNITNPSTEHAGRLSLIFCQFSIKSKL